MWNLVYDRALVSQHPTFKSVVNEARKLYPSASLKIRNQDVSYFEGAIDANPSAPHNIMVAIVDGILVTAQYDG